MTTARELDTWPNPVVPNIERLGSRTWPASCGELAPNAKLRPLVVPQGTELQEQATEAAVAGECELETVQDQSRPRRISWARLLKRVFDIDMQHCPNCGAGELKIIAAILERPVIEKILPHLGLDPQPPPRGRAREAGQDVAT